MDSFCIFMISLLAVISDIIIQQPTVQTQEKLSYYLDTSTSASNLTCQSLTKVYRSPTTGTPRVMEFKINTAYGYNQLLYTLELHVQQSVQLKLNFIESGKFIQEYDSTLDKLFSGSLCSVVTYKSLIHFTSKTQMNEQQATFQIATNIVKKLRNQQNNLLSNIATTFWIKNLQIYAERCQQHCKICVEASLCQECLPDFELNSFGYCQCKEQFLTYFQGQCITQCPVNHIFNGLTCIQYAQLINLLYDDTASKFMLQPDYNTTQRVCQTTLGSKNVAGLFIQNEAIEYKINNPVGTASNIFVEAEIYLLNFIPNQQHRLFFKLNNNLIGHYMIISSGHAINTQAIGAAKQNLCSIIGFTSCFKFIVVVQIENISDLSLLSVQANLPLEIKDVSWALSYIKVNAIIPLPITCPLKKYNNECVDKCPVHTRTSGNECISIINDYKFSTILRIRLTDDLAIQQKIKFDNPCDDASPFFSFACQFYQNRYILGGDYIWQSSQIRIVETTILAHYKIKLFFKAILIDPINSDQNIIVRVDTYKYTLNMNSPNSYCFSSVATPGCIIQEDLGLTNPDYLINFEEEFDHQSQQIEIFINCNTKQPSITYCGLYDLVILLANCPPNCKLCSSDSVCQQPESSLQVFYDCPSEGYFYSEGSCKKCQKFCKTCNDEQFCTTCKDNYFLYGNFCICKMNSIYAQNTDCMSDNCHPSCSICQNQVNSNVFSPYIKLFQLCAYCDSNEHKVLNANLCECFQGYYMDRSVNPSICYPCKETCKTCSDAVTCVTCFPDQNRIYYNYNCQCIDGYFENGFNPTCIKCTTLCKSCLYKEEYCIKCYNEQYRILSKENTCVCQNGYYDNKADVCLKCSDNCNTCSDYSICTSCDEFQFRVLDSHINQCVCQEGYYDTIEEIRYLNFFIILLQYLRKSSNQQFDKYTYCNNDLTCSPCYYTCSRCNNSNLISQCTLCPKTRLRSANNLDFFECKCRKGYFDDGYLECLSCLHVLNPPTTHQCYSICGDQIVQWDEECDDGNLDSRDGCDQCLIQNNNCIDSICLKCYTNLTNFSYSQYIFKSIQYIQLQYNQCLQCIDGYYVNHDFACIQCSEECQTCESSQNNCIKCKFFNPNTEECLICSKDHGFINIDNQCVSICGDGIRTFQEFCDDGNQINGDGCNQFCNIEDGYVCEVECQKINYIEILLQEDKLDNIYDSKRTIKLKFNQEIKISANSSITSLVKVTSNTPHLILNLISINDKSIFLNGYLNIALDLNIELDSSANSPSVNVIIQNQTLITNQQGQSFKTNRASIELIDFIKQDQIVIQNTKNLTQMSSYFLYILLGLAILAIIFGGLDIFWNLLDTLQLICYLKYFNITYPFNVQYYFTIFGFAEFDFIKSYFDFEYLITQYVDTPESDPKFYQEGYSTVFLVNIVSVVIVFITTTTTFIIIKIVLHFLHKVTKDICEDMIMMETEQISIFTFLFYKLTNSCQKYFLKIICEFKSALIRTFMASAYDLNLAIFLQFKAFNFSNPILKISSASALIVFFLEIYFIYICFQLMNKDLATLTLKEAQQNYGSLFEGLKLIQNHFHHYFNLFVVIKKATFMAILVFLYNTPCLQITLVSILNLSHALLYLYNKPLEDQNELIKQIICELILWFSVMLILAFGFNEQTNILDSHQITNIGWTIIGFLSLILFLQLIIDCKQHFQFLDQKYQLFKRLRVWYKYYFQNENNQSSLNTEYSQFSIVFNQRARQQTSAAKTQTQSNQVIQRRIVSFKLS